MEENQSEKVRQKRIQEMIADLNSKNERKVINALKMVPHEGSAEMMEPLFRLLQEGPNQEIRILLEKTLYNLKDPNCLPAMIDILKNKEHKAMHRDVLNAMWQSGLEVHDELELLVTLAIEGDFMTAMEVVTIIEHSEIDDDKALTSSIARMDKAVEIKDDKQDLMVSMSQLLLDKLLGDQ